jgi:uncharacterized phage-associated protein
MRMARENPLFTLQSLEKHKAKFSEDKYRRIRRKVVERVEESAIQYLKKQEISSIYVNFKEENEYNGYKILDLDKVASVIGYFAHSVINLFKVKLMKLLWYADALHFKRHGKAMTGLVYKHMTYGALPLAYDEIIHLPTVKIEEKIICDEISYKIIPNMKVNVSDFTVEELDVLETISTKFKNYNSKEIVEYMHEERACKETEPYNIISFNISKELRELR